MPMRVAVLSGMRPWLAGQNKRVICWNAICLFVMGGLLGGCTTLADCMIPGEAPPTPVAVAPSSFADPIPVIERHGLAKPPKQKKSMREVRQNPLPRESHEKVAVVNPDKLIGLEPGAVQKLLGAPARIRDDDLSREWIYAASGCSFRIFFYPNLNTAAFHALKYGSNDDNGELIDTSDVCIRHILTAKNNATD